MAFLCPYLVDDAYISFRISENLISNGEPFFDQNRAVYTSTSLIYPFINSIWYFLIGNNWKDFVILINSIFLGWSMSIVLKKAFEANPSSFWFPKLGTFLLMIPWFLDFKTLVFGNSGLETALYMWLLALVCIPTKESPFRPMSVAGWFLVLVRPEGILAGLAQLLSGTSTENFKSHIRFAMWGLLALVLWAGLGFYLYGTWMPQSILAKGNHAIDRWLEIRKGLAYLLFANHPFEFGIAICGFVFFPETRKMFILPLTWIGLYIAFFSLAAAWWPWYLPPLFVPFWFLTSISAHAILVWGQEYFEKNKAYLAGIPIVLGLLSFRVKETLMVSHKQIREASDGYQERNNSSKRIGHFLEKEIKPGQTILLEPLGMIAWYAKNKSFIDYPGLATPEMTAHLSTLKWKLPHRLTDSKTDSAVLEHFKPDILVLWPEEVNAFKKVRLFREKYGLLKKFDYVHTEKRMDTVRVFQKIRS